MIQSPLVKFQLKFDDWRVSRHFKRVEAIIRNRDVKDLALNLQLARQRYLDCLHVYATRGVFPRNHEHLIYSPCFIDRDGRECAVAHLVRISGQIELAKQIATVANYAYVSQMTFSELDDWAVQTGLNKEDLSLIQPGYWFTLADILPIVIVPWATGLITLLINIVQLALKRKGIIMALTGFVVAIALLPIGFYCLYGASIAYDLGAHPDGYPYDLPLHAVGPLVLGFTISIGLAALL